MKNLKYLIILLFVTILFSGCGKSNNLKDLSYSEFNSMRKDKETFFVIVIRDGCSHCESFIPKVEEVVDEYNITGYTLNLANLSESEEKEFFEEFNVDGTPTTVFITEGEEKSIMQRIDGNVSKEVLVNKLKANNYIK
jgi:thioredoxin-related protein